MKTPEMIMLEFANECSYDSWAELIYDSEFHSIEEYTKVIMLTFAKQAFEASRKCWDEEEQFIPKHEDFKDWYKKIENNKIKNI